MQRVTTLGELRQILLPPRETTRAKLLDHLDGQAMGFLAASPFVLLATTGCDGRIEVSPKGDEPGFVRVEDERTVLIPERPGNNLALSLENMLQNPRVGAIAMLPGTGETLRFSGRVEILADPALLESLAARGRAALLAIRVHVERAYFHCARSVLRAGLWKAETWSPPQRISFGRIIAARLGAGQAVEDGIDSFVADGYRTGL